MWIVISCFKLYYDKKQPQDSNRDYFSNRIRAFIYTTVREVKNKELITVDR